MRTKRLGDMLLELGLITQEQLKQALEFQSREKGRLGSILIEHNFITERQLIDALRMQLGIEYIDLTKVDIAPEMSVCPEKSGKAHEHCAGAQLKGAAVSGHGRSAQLYGGGGGTAHFQEAYCADDRFGTGCPACHQRALWQ